MYTPEIAFEAFQFLWSNYLTLSEKVDLGAMPYEVLPALPEETPVRPFRIAAGLARQGFFISAWSLWECYSRNLCQDLPKEEKQKKGESTVKWIARSLNSNSKSFTDQAWFASANCVRNLIAHAGGHVDINDSNSQSAKLLQRSQVAFPDIATWKDGYLALKHDHMADLKFKIEEFIRETA